MKQISKKLKITYWVVTALFVLPMLMSGFGYFTKGEKFIEGMTHLGYPVYLLNILGTFKILGAVAILSNFNRTLKEWAYAGFFINLLGAFASHLSVGDDASLFTPPLVILAIAGTSYALWRKTYPPVSE